MTHLFGKQRVFEIGQAGAMKLVVFMRTRRHEHIPEALGVGLLLQIFKHRDRLPAFTLGVLLLVGRHCGPDVLVHE